MRILHLVTHLRETGNGIVNSTVDLACLSAEEQTVAVAAECGIFAQLLTSFGAEVFELSQRRRPDAFLRSLFAYQRIIRKFRPDIVHAHTITGALMARALRFGRGYRVVTTVHNEFAREASLMQVGDLVTANSAAVAKLLQRRGVPKEKLRVVTIGALGSPRRSRYTRPAPFDLKRPAIATVAGLYERKGIDVLIAAFERLSPGPNLYIVGDGPDRERFREQAQRSAAAARIHLVGFEAQPERYLDSTDIFVLASRKEPFGMVISEAREAGCAVVASDVDGIPEALDGGAAGILVPPGNPEALAQALIRLLGDEDERRRWAAAAGNGLARFSAKRYRDEMFAVYKEVLTPDVPR